MPVPFTGLPQTLKVLPCFPALLWGHCRGMLRWEVRAVVTRWYGLGHGGRGRDNSRLRKREGFRKAAPLEERCGQHHRQQFISARKKRQRRARSPCWLRCNHGPANGRSCSLSRFAVGGGYQREPHGLNWPHLLNLQTFSAFRIKFSVYETMRSFTLSSSLNEQGNLYPPVRHYSYPNVMCTQIYTYSYSANLNPPPKKN